MFTCTGLSANNGSTLQAQYWLLPKNMHTFFYRYALAISSMMRYYLQDFIKSEHLQIINVWHISLYQRNFTLKWTIVIFIPILPLLFKGIMPHNSHIPTDDLRPPILHRNYIITFILIFSTFSCTCIFSCSSCFSALQKLVEFGMAVMFWTFIRDPVHNIYHNITLFHAFSIYENC